MTRKDNIFYKLTKENENSATELLCNLFRTKYMRTICLGFFNITDNAINCINIENITTQKSFDENGIPDIIIKNSDCYYIIENKIKIGTELQENQKTSYIDSIKKSKKRFTGYIFIIPKNYVHEYKINELKKNNNFINIVYWEEFLKYLVDLEIQDESPIVKESLDYLIKVVIKTSLYNEENFLSPYEVIMLYNSKDVLESLKLCSNVFNKMKYIENDILKIKGLKPGTDSNNISNFDSIGKYYFYDGKKEECIFTGLNLNLMNYNAIDIHDNTKKAENYVFSISFLKSYLKNNLQLDIDYFDDNEWLYFPLNKKLLIKEDNTKSLKEEIVNIIENVFLKNVI